MTKNTAKGLSTAMSEDKKDFMSLFDSIDKINLDKDAHDFSVENIQDEKAVLEFLDNISKRKPIEEGQEIQDVQKDAEKTGLLDQNYVKNSSIDDMQKMPRNSEETWFNGLLNNASFFVKQAEEKLKQFQHSEGKKIQKHMSQLIDVDTFGKLGIKEG